MNDMQRQRITQANSRLSYLFANHPMLKSAMNPTTFARYCTHPDPYVRSCAQLFHDRSMHWAFDVHGTVVQAYGFVNGLVWIAKTAEIPLWTTYHFCTDSGWYHYAFTPEAFITEVVQQYPVVPFLGIIV